MLVKERSSYAFNNLCVVENEIKVIYVTLELGDHLCNSKVGLLQRELNGGNIPIKLLQNQVHVHGQNGHKSENLNVLGRFLCEICDRLHKW